MNNNKRFIINIVSTAMRACGAAMLPVSLVGLYFGENSSAMVLFLMSIITITVGKQVGNFVPDPPEPPVSRVRYMSVLITWVLLIIIGAFPFYGAGDGYSYINSLFESCAGFCTTGISIIPFRTMPVCLQLWRVMCSWTGGLLCLMLTMSLSPSMLVTGRKLFSAEIPSLSMLKNSATYRGVYFKLMVVYSSITVGGTLLLILLGMRKFDSLITAMCSISTAGLPMFTLKETAAFNSGIKAVITLLNFLGSLNVALMYIAIIHGLKTAVKNNEFRMFIKVILAGTAVISGSQIVHLFHAGTLAASQGPLHIALQSCRTILNSLFMTVSFSSTSGYATTNFMDRTTMTTSVLLILSIIGACAVSTGGGIKISRFQIVAKTVRLGLFRHVHPSAVKPLKVNGKTLDSAVVLKYMMYMVLFLVFILFGALILSLDNLNIDQCFDISTAMLTTNGTILTNLGNETALVNSLTPLSKITMMVLMTAGRIEIYPVMMLLFKGFWITKSNK